MSNSPPSQPARKVSRLASVFVSVATVYIESRNQEALSEGIQLQKPAPLTAQDYASAGNYPQTTTYAMPTWTPTSPFLHALGFSDDPSLSIDGVSGAKANLENWFNGNQHIMGLLEDDLDYLDAAALNF
jgi:hypothetical protein